MKSQVLTLDLLKAELLKLEMRLNKKFDEEDQKAKDYRDDVLTKMDEVMGELENQRIERDFLKSDVHSLDERVTKLEASSKTA